MALTQLTVVKNKMNIALSDSSRDIQLQQCIDFADKIIKGYCKQNLETAIYTEYPQGRNYPDVTLKQYPVQAPVVTGNITATSPTITSLTATSALVVGMPAQAYSTANSSPLLPSTATILTVDSPTQVTLTANALTSQNSSTINFGLSMFFDPGGMFGDGPPVSGGPFPSTSQLILGRDYTLKRDQPGGQSRSAIVTRVGYNTLGGAPFTAMGNFGYGKGSLTAPILPAWPSFPPGAIKAVYAAGYGVGPTLPVDLMECANQCVAWLVRTARTGAYLTQEKLRDYMYQLTFPPLGAPPEIGEMRSILGAYRDAAM